MALQIFCQEVGQLHREREVCSSRDLFSCGSGVCQ